MRPAARITSYNVCYTKLLREQIFTRSVSDFASLAIVGGEGEGSERTIINVGGGDGEGRYEIFVDAKDLRSEDFPDDYIAALIFRGNQNVITSYSIHYTKLYDFLSANCKAI